MLPRSGCRRRAMLWEAPSARRPMPRTDPVPAGLELDRRVERVEDAAVFAAHGARSPPRCSWSVSVSFPTRLYQIFAFTGSPEALSPSANDPWRRVRPSCTIWLVRIHLITAESPESQRLRHGRLIQFPQLT